MFVFRKILHALFSWNTRYAIHPFTLLPANSKIKHMNAWNSVNGFFPMALLLDRWITNSGISGSKQVVGFIAIQVFHFSSQAVADFPSIYHIIKQFHSRNKSKNNSTKAGIQQLSQAWTISVPPFDVFRKNGTKLYHLVFNSSWHLCLVYHKWVDTT